MTMTYKMLSVVVINFSICAHVSAIACNSVIAVTL